MSLSLTLIKVIIGRNHLTTPCIIIPVVRFHHMAAQCAECGNSGDDHWAICRHSPEDD